MRQPLHATPASRAQQKNGKRGRRTREQPEHVDRYITGGTYRGRTSAIRRDVWREPTRSSHAPSDGSQSARIEPARCIRAVITKRGDVLRLIRRTQTKLLLASYLLCYRCRHSTNINVLKFAHSIGCRVNKKRQLRRRRFIISDTIRRMLARANTLP